MLPAFDLHRHAFFHGDAHRLATDQADAGQGAVDHIDPLGLPFPGHEKSFAGGKIAIGAGAQHQAGGGLGLNAPDRQADVAARRGGDVGHLPGIKDSGDLLG